MDPPTRPNLDNVLPHCNEHHHLVHEGGRHLTLHADRTTTLHRPDHSVSFEGSTGDVAPASVADLDHITLAQQRIDQLTANAA